MTTLKATPSPVLRRSVLAGAIGAIGLTAIAVRAEAQPNIVDVAVVNRETGETARVWRQGSRLFVAGQPGARYSVRVTNNTPGRVLVVMSVDGVNILTGETAGFGQRGYVFAPYETYDVTGWRKSDSEVAAFTFAPLPSSYAARTGRPNDVGVIGIAAFTERYYPPRQSQAPSVSPYARDREADSTLDETVVTGQRRAESNAPARPSAKSAPSAGAFAAAPPPPSEKLGTGHGAREWSQVTTVAFERASASPQQISRIEYDSVENLIAAGVIPRGRPRPPHPHPFPASPDGRGYVPDPPYGR